VGAITTSAHPKQRPAKCRPRTFHERPGSGRFCLGNCGRVGQRADFGQKLVRPSLLVMQPWGPARGGRVQENGGPAHDLLEIGARTESLARVPVSPVLSSDQQALIAELTRVKAPSPSNSFDASSMRS